MNSHREASSLEECLERISAVRGQSGVLAGCLLAKVQEDSPDSWLESADLLLDLAARAFPAKSNGARRVIKCRFLHDLRDCLRPKGVLGDRDEATPLAAR